GRGRADPGAGAPRRRRRAADGDVLGALLRLPLHAARRLLGRHPFGGLRGGPRLPAPVRGGHLRAHRSALGRGSDSVRHGRRPHRTRGVGHDLLRLHGGGNALSARTRDLAARGGPVRLRAPLPPRLRSARDEPGRSSIPQPHTLGAPRRSRGTPRYSARLLALHAPSSPDRYGRPHWSSYTISFSGPRPTEPKRPIG